MEDAPDRIFLRRESHSGSADTAQYEIHIRANLAASLKTLAGHHRVGQPFPGHERLWVDAICINQLDLAEKAVQVSLIHHIYASADEVIVYLGEEEDKSTETIRAIRDILVVKEELSPPVTSIVNGQARKMGSFARASPQPSQLILPEEARALAKVYFSCTSEWWMVNLSPTGFSRLGLPSFSHDLWPSLVRLYTRPWFFRLWTFQEAFLARSCSVVCGIELIPWDDLLDIGMFLARSGFMSVAQWAARLPRPSDRGDRYWDMPISHFRSLSEQYVQPDGKFLGALFNVMTRREASDPRDQIYAILRLMPTELSSLITVNYHEPFEEVFIKFTKSACASGTLKDLGTALLMAQSVSRKSGLPSWCPDYTQRMPSLKLFGERMPKLPNDGHEFKVDTTNPAIIFVSGVSIDRVTMALAPFKQALPVNNDHTIWADVQGRAAEKLGWLELLHDTIQARTGLPEAQVDSLLVDVLMVFHDVDRRNPDLARAIESFQILRTYLREMRECCDPALAGELGTKLYDDPSPSNPHIKNNAQMSQLWDDGAVFFATERGHFGMANVHARVGDHVCQLAGGWSLYLLRQKEERYEFVSATYVTDLSAGKDYGDPALQTFELC